MKLEFGIGKGTQIVEVPEKNVLGVLTPNDVERDLMGEEEVVRALENPIGAPRLREIVKPGEKIAIVTSDITRPMPTYKVMPALLDELYAGGAKAIMPGVSTREAIQENHRLMVNPAKLGADATILAMPIGGSTLPKVVAEE